MERPVRAADWRSVVCVTGCQPTSCSWRRFCGSARSRRRGGDLWGDGKSKRRRCFLRETTFKDEGGIVMQPCSRWLGAFGCPRGMWRCRWGLAVTLFFHGCGAVRCRAGNPNLAFRECAWRELTKSDRDPHNTCCCTILRVDLYTLYLVGAANSLASSRNLSQTLPAFRRAPVSLIAGPSTSDYRHSLSHSAGAATSTALRHLRLRPAKSLPERALPRS